MSTEEPRVAKALKLVDTGRSVAEAAKELGITPQAIYDAMKVRKLQQARGERACSECGQPLPPEARPSAQTCSGACRVKRSRRLVRELESKARIKINAEREKLGLPPIK